MPAKHLEDTSSKLIFASSPSRSIDSTSMTIFSFFSIFSLNWKMQLWLPQQLLVLPMIIPAPYRNEETTMPVSVHQTTRVIDQRAFKFFTFFKFQTQPLPRTLHRDRFRQRSFHQHWWLIASPIASRTQPQLRRPPVMLLCRSRRLEVVMVSSGRNRQKCGPF